jgi:hypothetical protein
MNKYNFTQQWYEEVFRYLIEYVLCNKLRMLVRQLTAYYMVRAQDIPLRSSHAKASRDARMSF